MRYLRFAALTLSIGFLLFALACGDDDEAPATLTPTESVTGAPSPTSPAPSPTEEAFNGGREPVEATPGVAATPLLRDARVAEHTTFDRIALEFEGGLPGYRVRYVEAPILADASGLEVEIAGNAFIEIRMEPAAAHDPNTGEETYTGPRELSAGLTSIIEAEQTGDFEAVLTWVLGVSEEADFRVLTLVDPPRLVVDVGHGRS